MASSTPHNDEERVQQIVSLFLSESNCDPSTVLLLFRYKEHSKLGFKLTNSARARQQQRVATINNNVQQQQRRHAPEVTQTARHRFRPPAAVLDNHSPGTTNSKRKRLGTASPTTMSTPEVLRETPQTEQATLNTSALSTGLRHYLHDPADANDTNDYDDAKSVDNSNVETEVDV